MTLKAALPWDRGAVFCNWPIRKPPYIEWVRRLWILFIKKFVILTKTLTYKKRFSRLPKQNMGVSFKGKHEPDEIELLLRKSGKDYCDMCGLSISGREVSIERLERWLGGKEKPMCQKCRLQTRRRKILIFIITPLILFLSYLIVKVLT